MNNCFSINTQVIISKKRKKKHFNAKSSSLTVVKREVGGREWEVGVEDGR